MRRLALPIAGTLLIVAAAANAAETITYSYDARGRLAQVARTGTVNNGVTTAYQFDRADNRTATTTTGLAPSAGPCVTVIPASGRYRVIPCAAPA